MKLHLGCGAKLLPPPWINADGAEAPVVAGAVGHPDVVLDLLTDLVTLPAAAYDHIYWSHGPEHVPPNCLAAVLGQLHDLLIPSGRLTLATTSFEGIFDAYLAGQPAATWNSYLFGYVKTGDPPFMAHRQVFTDESLTDLLKAAEFRDVRPWALTDYPEINTLYDCARTCADVSLLLEAVK